MRKNRQQYISLVGLSFALLTRVSSGASDGPYHFLKEIPVGGEGGWDYLSIDDTARRLYVSHGTKVVVIDIDKDAVAGEITNTPGIHGLAPAPELQRGFTSNGRENKCSIIDLKSLQTIAKVDTDQGPDGMLYDPGQQEAYMFNGRGQSATVIDAKAGKVVATIRLGGRPESAAVDPKGGRVYDNLEDKSEVVAIDTKTHTVVDRWPIAPGEEPAGLAIDVAHHRLFVGCHNKLMLMVDNTNGKVVASVPIGQGVDFSCFDPGTHLAFSSCGDGTVTIAHEDSPDKLTVIQTLTTERGARTMALDPKTHRIYLASAKFEAPAAGASSGGRERPKMVTDSFKILVYEMENK
jgi:DNA-binding beta-propeller fold protein YncE